MSDSPGSKPFRGDAESEDDVSSSCDLVLVVDADNTLWDTNEVFARAQLQLLELTEQAAGHLCQQEDRLRFVRAYDQAIAAEHHLHLKYPARLLVSAIIAGLSGTKPDAAAEAAIRGKPLHSALSERQIEGILDAYTQALAATPELLPTVREALECAKSLGLKVFVMTEGKLERQRSALTKHSLDDLIAKVWEMPKAKAQFERIRLRFTPAEVVVIGDQIDRDIVPSRDAGCTAILVPGRFKPRWENRDVQVADYVAPSLLSAVEWVARKQSLTAAPRP